MKRFSAQTRVNLRVPRFDPSRERQRPVRSVGACPRRNPSRERERADRIHQKGKGRRTTGASRRIESCWSVPALLLAWAGLSAPLPVLAQNQPKYQGGCADAGCHGDLLKRPVVHSPVENGACDACHKIDDAAKHKFRLTAKGADLCTECHEAEKFKDKVIHRPVADGQCDACHDPHGGKVKGLLKQEEIGPICTECHDETLKNLAFVHGPVAAGQCTACHSPHASPRPKLLVAEGRDLCFECHEDVKDRIASGKVVHQPVQTDCLACHKPHGAANKMMLAATAPDLCLDCHDTIAEQVAKAKFKHAPVTQPEGCTKCHDPHSSEGKKLLAKQPPANLCLSCHDKEIAGGGGHTVSNMAALLATNPDQHGPVRDGDCTACHLGHGGKHVAILAEPYPDRFYAAFSEETYKLCFDCHEAAAFESAETKDATAFRNGKQNLHYVHVNKPAKGRKCGACHDPHATKNPHHIADHARFGGWEIPIAYRATETGGGCQPGCHRAYRYDRTAPIANLQAQNPQSEVKPQ